MILTHVVFGTKKHDGGEVLQHETVTFAGNQKIYMAPGEEFYSDEIGINVEPDMDLVLSVYLEEKTNVQSACSTWAAKSWHTVYGCDGDFTITDIADAKESREIYPYVEADVNKANILVGICKIDVYTDKKVETTVLFGDSITHMSYFADALMQRLFQRCPGSITVINRGIGGNRILHDATYVEDIPGNGSVFGPAGAVRFENDAFDCGIPDKIVLLEGVNDMMHPEYFGHPDEAVTAEELEDAVKNMIGLAHDKGSKIWLGTVMPFHDDEQPLCPNGEKVWAEYNQWIRGQKLADGIVDFACVAADENRPNYMKAGLHIGDGLHPGEEGGRLMAEETLRVVFGEE